MPHGLVRNFLLYALVIVVLSVLNAVTQRWAEQRYFAGPRLDEWRQARRQLRGTDQPRVIWATSRNRPVSRTTLTGAQLAYVRYRQDMADGHRAGCEPPYQRSSGSAGGWRFPGGSGA